jgi:hypothetical protein
MLHLAPLRFPTLSNRAFFRAPGTEPSYEGRRKAVSAFGGSGAPELVHTVENKRRRRFSQGLGSSEGTRSVETIRPGLPQQDARTFPAPWRGESRQGMHKPFRTTCRNPAKLIAALMPSAGERS